MNPETPRRVALVVESPFSARDEQRFGFRQLTDAGLAVEVWDIGALTLPNAREQWIEPSGLERVHRLDNWPAVEKLAMGMSTSDAVVLISGVYGRLDELHAPLLDCVLRSSALVGAIVGGTIPPVRGLAVLRGQVLSVVISALSLRRTSVTPPRPLDFVWAGTTSKAIARPLIGSTTTVRLLHALDYDRILDLPDAPDPHGDFVLLLDAMGPLHPDYVTLGLDNPWTIEAYRDLMQAACNAVEDVGLPVVVAAHPRARPGSLVELYPGREVRHGETPQLMQRCTYVLTLEGSTSLGIAAHLKKPVLFVEDPAVPRATRVLATAFRRALHAPTARIRSGPERWNQPEIDERAFRSYVRKYLKEPETPEARFWDVVAADIQSRLVCNQDAAPN